jgi:hypothetical protein
MISHFLVELVIHLTDLSNLKLCQFYCLLPPIEITLNSKAIMIKININEYLLLFSKFKQNH